MNSRKSVCRIVHSPTPVPRNRPLRAPRYAPPRYPLVTPMDRYAGLWMLPRCKLMSARKAPKPSSPGPLGPGLSAFEVVFLFDVQGLPHQGAVTQHVFGGRVFPDDSRENDERTGGLPYVLCRKDEL